MAVEGWSVSYIDELAKDGLIADGDWVESKDQDPNGDVRLIQLADIGDGIFIDKSERFLTSRKAKDLRCTYLKADDILIARMPDPLGRACIFPELNQDCVTVVDVCLIRTNSKSVNNVWLKEYINSPFFRNKMEEMSSGTTRKRISRNNLSKIHIDVPPLSEQKKIAEILGSVDDAIAKTESVIAQTQRVKQGLLQQLLTRGIGHTKFKQTELGEIPESWEIKTLGKMANIKGGKRLPKGHGFSELPTSYKYIRVTDFENGTVNLDNVPYITTEDAQVIKRYTISSKDLYISIAGTLGLVGIIPCELDGANLTENAAKITSINKEIIYKDYLLEVMRSPLIQDQINSLKGVGGGVPKLALFRIESLCLPVPPLSEQEIISAILKKVSISYEGNIRNLHELKKIKIGLMSDLLTGRVRVNVDAKTLDKIEAAA